MIWRGYKEVAIGSIKVDAADVRNRMKQQHVLDLAETIREYGDEPIHAPTVRMPGKELLCGRDRMAALLTLKVKKLWVRPCECTDLEAADLEAIENVHRRQDSRSDVIARAVAVKERLLTERTPLQVSHPPQSSPKAEARRAVAAAAGVTTGAVRQAEYRSKQREEAERAPAEPSEPAAPTLELLGCNDASGEAVAKFARKDQEAIDEADKYLRLAVAALERMAPGGEAAALRARVASVAAFVRAARPVSVCPKCKGLPKTTVAGCKPCAGLGYVPEAVLASMRPELLDIEHPAVELDGVLYPYADVRDGKLPVVHGEAKPAGKRIRVEDEAGNEINTEDGEQAY